MTMLQGRWTAICYYVLHDGIYDYIYSTMNLLVISYWPDFRTDR